MTIHHVEVEGIHTCIFSALHFLTQAGVIRGKQGRADVDHFSRARSRECVGDLFCCLCRVGLCRDAASDHDSINRDAMEEGENIIVNTAGNGNIETEGAHFTNRVHSLFIP